MEIHQLVYGMVYGDAISNSAFNIKRYLNEKGIASEIYAMVIHPKLLGVVRHFTEIPTDQHVIYHLSVGCPLSYKIPEFSRKRILLYHNITPSHYFKDYFPTAVEMCDQGRVELAYLRPYIDVAFADSEYNRKELLEYGYVRTEVTPIIINFDEYDAPHSIAVSHSLSYFKKGKDILFVGRLAPNKKYEDLIQIFYFYKKYICPGARLFLIGSFFEDEYYEKLKNLVALLSIKDVYMMGHVPFNQLLSYYKNADLFLCMSEHEGFCVPLLEAMHFRIPIIAYECTAIGETVGKGGMLVNHKDSFKIATDIQYVLENEDLQLNMLEHQKERLQYYSKQSTERIWWNEIQKVIPFN